MGDRDVSKHWVASKLWASLWAPAAALVEQPLTWWAGLLAGTEQSTAPQCPAMRSLASLQSVWREVVRCSSKPILLQGKKIFKKDAESQSEAVELDPELGFAKEHIQHKVLCMLLKDAVGAQHLIQMKCSSWWAEQCTAAPHGPQCQQHKDIWDRLGHTGSRHGSWTSSGLLLKPKHILISLLLGSLSQGMHQKKDYLKTYFSPPGY